MRFKRPPFGCGLPSHREGREARAEASPATSRAPETARRVAMGLGQVSWLPDHPRKDPFPEAKPASRIARRQWDVVLRVPGHSGGGRAGISPASLSRPPEDGGPEIR